MAIVGRAPLPIGLFVSICDHVTAHHLDDPQLLMDLPPIMSAGAARV
jgi:hypothetical protein